MISIIVATFNSQATLARCLDGLRAQEGADFELLLADGASSDATLDILSGNSDLISWQCSEPDRGVYDAWNKAIRHARGEWIMFLGSDDWLQSDTTLSHLRAHLAAIPADERPLSFVFGQTALVDGEREIERLGAGPLPGDRLDFDADVPFSHTGLVHHRSLFDKFGLYDASYRSAGDYEFLIRASLDVRVRFRHIDQIVARMASGGMSNAAASRVRHYREMQAARLGHGLTPKPGWLRTARMRANCLNFLDSYCGPGLALLAANAYRCLRGKPTRSVV